MLPCVPRKKFNIQNSLVFNLIIQRSMLFYNLQAFDTVNHSMILKKLELYVIHRKNLEWYKSYSSSRKQYIHIDDNNKTYFLSVTCGIVQGSILGPLLLLLYVNDLPNDSKILTPIIFADDTNLFFSNCDIPVLFVTVNSELSKINQWFFANKLSLNITKTKYSFFYKTSKKGNRAAAYSKDIVQKFRGFPNLRNWFELTELTCYCLEMILTSI